MIAIWNGEIIAHSTDTIRVEGYRYFSTRQRGLERPDSQHNHLAVLVEGQSPYYHVRAARHPAREAVFAGYNERDTLQIVLAIAVKTISNYTNHLFLTPLVPGLAHRAWEP